MSNAIELEPKFSIDLDTRDVVNTFCGSGYHDGLVKIEFHGTSYQNPADNRDLLLVSFDHTSVKFNCFIAKSEFRRLLDCEISDLSIEYIIYLINKHFVASGLSFHAASNADDVTGNTLLINATITLEGKSFNVMVLPQSLQADLYYLNSRLTLLDPDLVVYSAIQPFHTFLTAPELLDLESGDFVFVYPSTYDG